jgi:hypothetical protein
LRELGQGDYLDAQDRRSGLLALVLKARVSDRAGVGETLA